jgi:hypothetical protein
MKTENLTAALAANLEPVDSRRTTRRYALGMTAGALAALSPGQSKRDGKIFDDGVPLATNRRPITEARPPCRATVTHLPLT